MKESAIQSSCEGMFHAAANRKRKSPEVRTCLMGSGSSKKVMENNKREKVAERVPGPDNSMHYRSQEGSSISLKCNEKLFEGSDQGNDMTQFIF